MIKNWSKSFSFGAVAFVFLVIGYQCALFVHKAAVARVVAESSEGRHSLEDAGAERGIELDGDREQGLSENLAGAREEKPGEGRAEGRGEGLAESRASDRAEGRAEREAEHHAEVRAAIKKTFREKQEFTFNPNTASLEDFQRLGFSEKQAQSIVNYRVKGGRFYRKEDFAKSYVVSPEDYARLEAYISIPLLDINAADSAAFDALPGIGGYFAAKMVEFRQRLGGRYVAKEQLLDIYNFGRERYDRLADLVYVGPGLAGGSVASSGAVGSGAGAGVGSGTAGSGAGAGVGSGAVGSGAVGSGADTGVGSGLTGGTAGGKPVLRLWSMPEDSLKLNPYIGSWKVAHQITLYKKSKPKGPWTVEDLAANGILPKETAAKLTMYYQTE